MSEELQSEELHTEIQKKETERPQEFQDDIQKRLNKVIGQLHGVKNMIDDNRYCGDVLIQLSAASSALRTVSALIMENHMQTCVVEKIKCDDPEVVEETVQLMKKFLR